MSVNRQAFKLFFVAALALGLCAVASLPYAKSWFSREPAASTIGVADLPPEARATLALIRAGGPFPYPKDGVVFGNREKLLPKMPRGFYTEYTVKTPGSKDRGARRLVVGGEPKTSAEIYYTDDHYQSFRLVK